MSSLPGGDDRVQASLFDLAAVQPTTAPTCPGCQLRPARWNHVRQEYSRYCSGNHCSNHQRTCRHCGEVYDREAAGAGTRYCSPECKAHGYANTTRRETPCANCGHPFRGEVRRRDQTCSRCRGRYAGQINRHNMDTAWALRLINAVDCDACGDRLPSGHGKHLGVVDHDHGCCPGGSSCGNCIRGIICGRCNTYAGYIEKDPERLQAVVRYLGL